MKDHRKLVVLVVVLVGALLSAGVVAVTLIVKEGSGNDPDKVATDLVESFFDDNADAAFELIAPAQQESIGKDNWSSMFEVMDGTCLNRVWTDRDPAPGDDLEIINSLTDEINEHPELVGLIEETFPGTRGKSYPVGSVTIGWDTSDGEQAEASIDMVQDDGRWYAAIENKPMGPRKENSLKYDSDALKEVIDDDSIESSQYLMNCDQ